MEVVHFGKYLGDAMKAAREGAGLTQQEIADPLGKTKGEISKYESAQHWPEKPEVVLAAYERETKVSIVDLFSDAVKRANEAKKQGHLEIFRLELGPSSGEIQKHADQAIEDLPTPNNGSGSD